MKQHIAHVTLLVRDYDEAINFYCGKLNFTLIEDTRLSDTKRWVLVAPPGSAGCRLLLAQAADDTQREAIGQQAGGRVFLFLYTDDLKRDYAHLQAQGITIIREPVDQPYGQVAVFADVYGNRWDLLEPRNKSLLG